MLQSVHALVLAWNATDRPLPEDARLEQWIARQAQATPSAIAITAKAESLTYGQMMVRANRFAHALRHRGVGPGQLVGVCVERGLDLIPVLLGVWQTGAAYVPLDPVFPPERLRYMAEDAHISLIVTESKHAALTKLPRDRQLRLDEDAAEIEATSSTPLPLIQGPSHAAPAYVIYTSGSTGQPKGVVLPHRAVCNFITSMCREPGFTATDRLLAVTTLSFDIAVLELFAPLTVGAQVILAQREDTIDGHALAGLVKEHAISLMQATPTTWQLMLEAGWQAPSTLRMLCGGEPMLPSLAERLLKWGAQLWNMYGPTETTVWSTLAHISNAQNPVTIGRPIDNTQAWVLDEFMHPVAVGQAGELWLGGLGVAMGYLNRPQLTQERFVNDPFRPNDPQARLYRTGDLARWREDGTLDHLGRMDHQVKIRGHRIELGEIESVLSRVPGVARNVVMPIEDGPSDVRLVAYVVPAAGSTLNESALKEALRHQLPDYMLPHNWVLLTALPLLPNGKIDRKSLPSPFQKPKLLKPEPLAANAPKDPLSETQHTVARAMCKILKIGSMGPDDDFFAVGGDSLLAARLISQINREHGQQFTLRTLLEAPTVALLAERIAAPLTEDSVICLRSGGNRTPIFFIHDGDGDTMLYRKLAKALNPEHPIYGLAPLSTDGFAMVHTRVSEIASFQVEKIRSIQARGPYMLSGLCAGGVIAFEVACLLQVQGESVAMLALLDAADGRARPRAMHVSKQRLSRFTASIKSVFAPNSGHSSMQFIGSTLSKVGNLVAYEGRALWQKIRTTAFVSLLRWHLDRGRQPPAFLRQLSVRQIYFYAEMSHSHDAIFKGTLHLFRATQGDGTPADETFLEAYSDPLFGWGRRVRGKVVTIDAPGGHSSMLQPPCVDTLALALQECIDQSQLAGASGQCELVNAA